MQRGGIVEKQIHIQVEQIGHPKVNRLFNGFLVRLQEIHGPIQVVQFQVLGTG